MVEALKTSAVGLFPKVDYWQVGLNAQPSYSLSIMQNLLSEIDDFKSF